MFEVLDQRQVQDTRLEAWETVRKGLVDALRIAERGAGSDWAEIRMIARHALCDLEELKP